MAPPVFWQGKVRKRFYHNLISLFFPILLRSYYRYSFDTLSDTPTDTLSDQSIMYHMTSPKINNIVLSNYTMPKNELPSSVRLFKAGENKTSKGVFYYDPSMKDIIIKNAELDGRDLLPIDIAHLSVSSGVDNPAAHRAYGWFRLSVEDEGIFAKDIEWTKAGKELLEDRAFRFISPTFTVEELNNKDTISSIINFALTNEPATYQPMALVASKELNPNSILDQSNKDTNQMKHTVKLDDAATEEEEKQLEELVEKIEEIIEEEEEVKLEDSLIDEEVDWKATAETLQSQLEAARDKILDLMQEIEELKSERLSEEEAEEESIIEALLEELDIEEEDKEVFAALGKERLMKLAAIKKPKALSKSKLAPSLIISPKTNHTVQLSDDVQAKIKRGIAQRFKRRG